MRRFPFLLFPFLALTLHAADLSIVRVWPGYRSAESFERIADYFGNGTRADAILRSPPGEQAGYYFLVRLSNHGTARKGCTWELHIITQDSPQPRLFSFATDLPAGSHVFQLGLTGVDWPHENREPVAWQLILRGTGGEELIRHQSFLWERNTR